VDESGDHVFHDEATLQEERHRYLALIGCWMSTGEEYVSFHRALEDLKHRHFPHNPDDPVVLHRDDIVRCRGPFARLKDYLLRSRFDDDLITLISQTEFTLVGVVIDKLMLRERYLFPFHPYHTAMDFLLQRYCGWLNHFGGCGDVLAESRGGTEDRLLSKAYTYVWENGDRFRSARFFQNTLTSKQLKLKRKNENISGLQLADLLAHPLRRYVLIQANAATRPTTIFENRIFPVIEAKFNRHAHSTRAEGYGWVLFPR